MLNIWTVKTNYNLGSIQERTAISIGLPIQQFPEIYDSTQLLFKVISGELPPGLRIDGDRIVGTAFEVSRITDFRFVIRASYNQEISDRTFFLRVSGSDIPSWNTVAGTLPTGPNNAYYVLDNSYIDFQLAVVDSDTAAGQSLKYFIPSGGGELPPGLILLETGRIVGWVQPVLAPPLKKGNGRFDKSLYDDISYDYGLRPSNGYDTYIFDAVTYDLFQESLPPRKINRNFEFTVIVTDGDSFSSRTFKIFVVGDDFFRADNTVTTAGNGTFTADVTYARAPIWTTPSYLGLFRANNYKTFKLDVYEGLLLGPISYDLESVIPDVVGKASTNLNTENRSGTNKIHLVNVRGTPAVNQKLQLSEYVKGASPKIYNINGVQLVAANEYILTLNENLEKTIPNETYIFFGPLSVTPPGMIFDPTTGELFGNIPYQTAITKDYRFCIKATRFTEKGETASSKRTFSATILGEVDSTITWNTDSDLGMIGANYVSTLKISASTTYIDSPVLFYLTGGQLPPGLTLNFDGEIVGKVTQFGNIGDPGLITFDAENLTFDGGDTTFDRTYQFTVEARDVLGYNSISRTFTLAVDTPNDRLYSNLTVRPFLKQNQREYFRSFINNAEIFPITSIYRPNDPNFGIQKDLRMLIYAGIETKSAGEFISMLGKNHKIKKFLLGDIKKAKGNAPFSKDTIYEVIYVEVFDPLEIGKKYLPSVIKTSKSKPPITVDQNNEYYNGPLNNNVNPFYKKPDPFNVTLDRTDIFAGDPQNEYKFANSVSIWRNRIKAMGLKDSTYLPLWMRTIQDGSIQPIGFVKAIPICYCLPGKADDIILNIKNSEFDFKLIDYVIDRYIVDSVSPFSNVPALSVGVDKYLVFRNDRTTIS